MFKKILIANRGEIACRIIRTIHRMGIKTVAIYSEVDQFSLHSEMADEAYLVGPAPTCESYLNQEKIIKIALQANAEAIHPGYGFLSENADFAERVRQAGLVFIGPSPQIIRAMGDKLEAKAIAEKAGVSLVPGSKTPLESPEQVYAFAKQHGFPLLLKAAAGGGGKGMRVVRAATEIEENLERAQNEALKSFGDNRIFVERYIDQPRHIEVQILGDQHGNVVHLGERDCSLQRRHQKIIEENPSPFITPELRQRLTSQALSLAKTVNYDSAGTVEFIVSANHECFFLEMNTRLQVEHPVTEMVYQVDLVEHMVRLAAGEKLSLSQERLTPHGWAMEARLYSEDPYQDFMPSTGRLSQLVFPESSNVRFDTGVREGDQISIYYDPMIAKVIAHGNDRDEAIHRLRNALSHTLLDGPQNNRIFLLQLLHHQTFLSGQGHTHFIEQNQLTQMSPLELFRQLSPEQQQIFLTVSALLHQQRITPQDQKNLIALIEGHPYPVPEFTSTKLEWLIPYQRFQVTLPNHTILGEVHFKYPGFVLGLFGVQAQTMVMRQSIWQMLQHLPPKREHHELKVVKSPMPGVLVALPISVGDRINKGQTMAIIEAMKMENAIKAPTSGVVTEILVKNGDNLSRDQIIAKFGT
jgi:propionyl-CoA carboxylase alpha chain